MRNAQTYPRGVMVAAIDSKSIAVWRAGSIPAGGTNRNGVLAWIQRHCKNVSTGDLQRACKRTEQLARKPDAGTPPIFVKRNGPIPEIIKNLLLC